MPRTPSASVDPFGRHAHNRRLEELPNDAESEVTLQLAAPRAQQADPLTLESASRSSQQRGLTDSSLTHHNRSTPAAITRSLADAFQPLKLRISLQESHTHTAHAPSLILTRWPAFSHGKPGW